LTTAKELLKQRYYEPIKEQPELFVGIELEYPVVNLSGNATDVSLTKQLLGIPVTVIIQPSERSGGIRVAVD
jgi:gamma-glutamylcysteine synthetase